jgi:hypothetical protein
MRRLKKGFIVISSVLALILAVIPIINSKEGEILYTVKQILIQLKEITKHAVKDGQSQVDNSASNDLTEAKDLIEGASYTDTQTSVISKAQAEERVKSVIKGLNLNGVRN